MDCLKWPIQNSYVAMMKGREISIQPTTKHRIPLEVPSEILSSDDTIARFFSCTFQFASEEIKHICQF